MVVQLSGQGVILVAVAHLVAGLGLHDGGALAAAAILVAAVGGQHGESGVKKLPRKDRQLLLLKG